jgi:hypothetical protein
MDLTDKFLSSAIKQVGVQAFIEMNRRQYAEVEAQDLDENLKRCTLYSTDRIMELGLAAYAKRYKNGAAEIAAVREVMR